MTEIKNIGVIGAGVMGAGIAAQAANAGAKVLLLDVVEGAAEKAVQKLLKTEPAAFMHKKFARRVTTGNSETALKKIADCDWIVEAVVEDPKIKQALYQRLHTHLKADAIVSSNTSTLPLATLCEGMNPDLQRRFMITHFFNPPRYMQLLEIVASDSSDQALLAQLQDYCDINMGKSVVIAKDTPGFIANRIGTFWLQAAVTEAFKQKMDVEIVDAVLGRPAGSPRTGIFGLLDLIGLDLMPHVLKSLGEALGENDAFHKLGSVPDLLSKMIEDGYTGRKGKGGFYRLRQRGEKKVKEVIDLGTGTYAPAKRPRPAATKIFPSKGLRGTLEHDSEAGWYARSVLLPTLAYAASLIPEIADTPEEIDRSMRLGYNWKFGPFELIDQLGTPWFVSALQKDRLPVPAFLRDLGDGPVYKLSKKSGAGQLHQFVKQKYQPVIRPQGVLLLQDIKRKSKPLAQNKSARLWDMGEGVLCLEFTSRMNSLNPFTLLMIEKAIKIIPKQGYKALVLHNEGRNFSVGANIGLLLYGAKFRLWPFIRWMVRRGQKTFQAMRHAPFPIVAAPSGMALGGGCEVILHCDAVVAHSETYMGLVEAGVGIVPGWGGCKELLCRFAEDEKLPKGPMPKVMKAFETIALAQVAKSAVEAHDFKFLRPQDHVIMNQDRVLAGAKKHALELAENYTPPEKRVLSLPGLTGQTALDLAVRDFIAKGVASPHDGKIAHELGHVLCGGQVSHLDNLQEQDILDLEVAAIDKLIRTKKTLARVEHMLKLGKPLRN